MLKLTLATGVIAGFLFFLLNEYFALGFVGRIFSWGLTVLILTLAMSSATKGLSGFLVVSSLSAKENRQLSTLHDLDSVIFDADYFTFFTTEFSGFNLYIWTLLIMAVISLLRVTFARRKILLGKSLNLLIGLMFLVTMVFFSTLVDLPLRQSVEYQYIISDIRPLLVFVLGLIIMIDVKNEFIIESLGSTFVSLLKFLAAGLGTLFIFTLMNDLYQDQLRFHFNTSPHIMWPFFFTCIFCGKHLGSHYGVLSFAGAFKIARGEMLNIGLSLVMAIVYSGKLITGMSQIQKKYILRAIMVFFVVIGGLLTYMRFNYPYIVEFIVFKFSFFVGLMSGEVASSSVSMRVIELQNILAFHWNNLGSLFWGRGLGAYFTFVEFSPPRSLELHDFTLDQISSGLFYKPHHFVNFLLLKVGLIGLCCYILFCFKFIGLGVKLIKLGGDDVRILGCYLFFFSLYCLNMYWQPVLIVWALFAYSAGEMSLREIENGYRNS